jgi:hypothetical protein
MKSLDVDGNKVSHQLSNEHVSGNVTCTPFATIFLTKLDRFYKAFDVVELDGQDYVLSCVVVFRANDTIRAIVVLNPPVIKFFDG